jgi:hypothetical protein
MRYALSAIALVVVMPVMWLAGCVADDAGPLPEQGDGGSAGGVNVGGAGGNGGAGDANNVGGSGGGTAPGARCIDKIVACSLAYPCFVYMECMYCEAGPHYSVCCNDNERVCESYLDLDVACRSDIKGPMEFCSDLTTFCGPPPKAYIDLVEMCD